MSQFQHHPDGIIYVRADGETYADTVANFETDFGSPYEGLPEGATGRIYEPGVRHAISKPGGVAGGDMPWQQGDDAIAAVSTLIQAQSGRQPVPPSAPRQFTRLQILEALYELKGDAFVDAALKNMQDNSPKAYNRWIAATRIDENDPDFLAQLSAMGITLDELKAEIDAQ